MKNNRDIFEYKVVCDEFDNSIEDVRQNILNVDFVIKPVSPEMRLRLFYATIMEFWKKEKLITDYDISEENGQMIVTFSFDHEGPPESSKNDDKSGT